MSRRDNDAPMRARVPADVERKDTIMFGLTFRQLVILTVTGLIIYAAWTALAQTVPPLGFRHRRRAGRRFAFVLAVGRRDGICLDAWLLHAVRHRRAPHRLIHPTGRSTRPRPGSPPLPGPAARAATRAAATAGEGITGGGLIDLARTAPPPSSRPRRWHSGCGA